MEAAERLSSEPAAEPPVRPKLSRRPAQFSAPAATLKILPALPLDAATNDRNAPPPAHKAWQDDGRFALALLTIVIAMNVAVTFWLSYLERAPLPTAVSHSAPTDSEADAWSLSPATVHVLDGLASPIATDQ